MNETSMMGPSAPLDAQDMSMLPGSESFLNQTTHPSNTSQFPSSQEAAREESLAVEPRNVSGPFSAAANDEDELQVERNNNAYNFFESD